MSTCEDNSCELKSRDVISVRGYGKFRRLGSHGLSRKGKHLIFYRSGVYLNTFLQYISFRTELQEDTTVQHPTFSITAFPYNVICSDSAGTKMQSPLKMEKTEIQSQSCRSRRLREAPGRSSTCAHLRHFFTRPYSAKALDLKVTAPSEELRCITAPKVQCPHRLARLRRMAEVRTSIALSMCNSRGFPLHQTVIIIQPVGKVVALLNLSHQRTAPMAWTVPGAR